MIETLPGSVLDSKCDLLVLPCNTDGEVTSWVAQEIAANGLPQPKGPIDLGAIQFYPTLSAYPKADHVAFAACVDAARGRSELSVVEMALTRIQRYAEATDCTLVNIPLLGTGAGELSREEVGTLYERVLAASPRMFRTMVPPDRFTRGPLPFVCIKADPKPPPRVFISYSRSNKLNAAWVLTLATQLRSSGVDARVDQLHLKPGMDIPQWMTNELLKAERVLLICDQTYAHKADTQSAGVAWETMIVQGDLLTQGTTSEKYIAISIDGDPQTIPVYLRTKLYLSGAELEPNLDPLLRLLFHNDSIPPIGSRPAWAK